MTLCITTPPPPPLIVTSPEEKQRKRRRGESGRVESEEVAEKKRLKKEILRPNYFVSIPITNSKVPLFTFSFSEKVSWVNIALWLPGLSQ